MSISMIGEYRIFGDVAIISVPGCSIIAPWTQWETLRQLLEIGVMPSLTKIEGYPDQQDWVTPGGQTLAIPIGAEGEFFEAVLKTLHNLHTIRLALGGVRGYYKRVGLGAGWTGGHRESPESLDGCVAELRR